MSGVFKTVLSLSVSGSAVILVLLLCGPLARKRLSRRWQYYIWLAAVARLLLPFSPEGSPVGTLFQRTVEPDAAAVSGSVPAPAAPGNTAPDFPEPAGDGGEIPVSPGVPAETAPAKAEIDLWSLLSALWLGGALILLARKVTAYQDFSRFIRAGCREVSDPVLLDRLARIGAEAGVRRPVELFVAPEASSPMLLGLFRPRIVLTALEMPEDDFRYTVLHELTHCRRRDLAYKWLVQAAVCLHWFNPLVWLMAREIGRACELACDESVLRTLDGPERRAYGDMLLRAAEAGGVLGASCGSATLSENGKLLKERLTAIMSFKKTTRTAAALSLVLTIALTAGAAAAGAYSGPARSSAAPERDTDAAFFYTQEGYYQPPYLFEVAWNISEAATKDYASARAALPEGGAMTVYFEDACKGMAGDKTAMDALSALLGRLRSEPFPITRPLVVSARNIQGADPAALAERYYEEGALPQFGAVFPQLNKNAQEAMLEKLYDDGSTAFFSMALKHLEPGSPLAARLSERAYDGGNIAFFSLLVEHTASQAELEVWLARAREDGRLNFTSVLLDTLDRDEELETLKAEAEARLVREYAAHGVTKNGQEYRWNNQLVRIFLDVRSADSSFVTLSINPKGTVDIKVSRGGDGAITAVSLMDSAEAEALLADMNDPDGGWDKPVTTASPAGATAGGGAVTVNIPRLGPQQDGIAWLGEFDLAPGDQIRYDVSAETGPFLQVGFVRGQESPDSRRFCSVSNPRTDGVLRCASSFTFPAEAGTYRLFVRAPEGAVGNVRGSVVITPRGQAEKQDFVPSEEQVLAARRQALAGMTQSQVQRLNTVIRQANLWWEHKYLYDNIFQELENPESLYWNYFDRTGEIQTGWAYDGELDIETVCRREHLTEDQFYAKYGTPVVTENAYDADNFIALLDELTASVRSQSLRSALEYIREEVRLAAEQHSMEHANNEYRALHDLDYFLLRYGPADVGPYVTDGSTICKYYGTLSVYTK